MPSKPYTTEDLEQARKWIAEDDPNSMEFYITAGDLRRLLATIEVRTKERDVHFERANLAEKEVRVLQNKYDDAWMAHRQAEVYLQEANTEIERLKKELDEVLSFLSKEEDAYVRQRELRIQAEDRARRLGEAMRWVWERLRQVLPQPE